MPLLDHFHRPVFPLHDWEAFHGRWAFAMSDRLNELLPPQRYLAEAQIHIGSRIEADVSEFELQPPVLTGKGNGSEGRVAVEVQTWAPRSRLPWDNPYPCSLWHCAELSLSQ